MFSGFARRNNPYDATAVTLAVANQKKTRPAAHAEHKKTFFIRRVFFIVKLNCEFVVKHRLRFLERNAMFLEVGGGFGGIPVKRYHLYIVWMVLENARAGIRKSGLCQGPPYKLASWN